MRRLWPVMLAVAVALALAGGGLRAGEAATSDKVALVIGNSAYRYVKGLPSPVADADRWAKALKGAGFSVESCPDCTLTQMKAKLSSFKSRIKPGDEALFYYSGHGAEENDINLLFPVDADIQGCGTMFEQSVTLGLVQDSMEQARVKVVVLDACRNSPFPTCTKDVSQQVFGRPQVLPSGTLIAYATTRGSTAADYGKGSPYSNAVLPLAFEPGRPLLQALSDAAFKVSADTGGQQVPWVLNSLSGDAYSLVPGVSAIEAAERAWRAVVAMPDGDAKYTAVLNFLAAHGSSGAASVTAAKAWLTAQVRGGADRPAEALPPSATPISSPIEVRRVPTSVPIGKIGDPPVGGPTGRIYAALKGTTAELSFVELSAGAFTMGSPEGEGSDDEYPQRRVSLSPFAIGRSEVTQAQWSAVVLAAQRAKDKDATGLKADPSSFKGARRPVEQVSWCDAARFANALSRLERLSPAYTVGSDCERRGEVAWDRSASGYRLPTEAEWEYAARAGTKTTWPFEEKSKQFCAYANFLDLLGKKIHPEYSWADERCEDGYADTAPVCSLKSNLWGLCDTLGNVYEWVWDWYGSGYDAAEVGNPSGSGRGVSRVLRGGSWDAAPARPADRYYWQPSDANYGVGFRLVLPVAASEP